MLEAIGFGSQQEGPDLDQAAILFANKEFEGTSMRDIALLAASPILDPLSL